MHELQVGWDTVEGTIAQAMAFGHDAADMNDGPIVIRVDSAPAINAAAALAAVIASGITANVVVSDGHRAVSIMTSNGTVDGVSHGMEV